MTDIKQADAMMRMARRDMAALRGMSDATIFADEIFGYHVQQTIEKGLKAWMCALGLTYPFTHHINRLLTLLRDVGADVEAFWWTDEFTIYAHQARYEEGHLSADAPLDRHEILGNIDSLLQQVDQSIQMLR